MTVAESKQRSSLPEIPGSAFYSISTFQPSPLASAGFGLKLLIHMTAGPKTRLVEPDVTVVELTGHLNLGNSLIGIEAAIKRLIDEGARKVVIDASGLNYVDSAGIGMLVSCTG